MKNFIFLVWITSSLSFASLTSVKWSSTTSVPSTRWIFDSKSKINSKYKALAQIKVDYQNGKFAFCSQKALSLLPKFKTIQPWILLIASQCEFELQKNAVKISASKSRELVQKILSQKDWLLFGPYSGDLKNIVVELQLIVVDWDIKNRPQLASTSIGKLFDMDDWMNSDQRARLYKAAAEHAFLQQNLITAKAYIQKSLQEQENPKLMERLAAIESALLKKSSENSTFSKPQVITAGQLGLDEQKIVERMTLALKGGDLLSAARDGLEVIRKYPGSIHADWAALRIQESYLTILSQGSEEKIKVLKSDFLDVMLDADSNRLFEWGVKVYKIGFYKEALSLLEESYSKMGDSFFNPQVNDFLAKAYMSNADFDRAEKILNATAQKYAGTKESVDAYFNLGLIYFLKKKFPKAQASFEKLLSQSEFLEHEVAARYWLWRASQKLDSARAQAESQILVSKFPFSYYGLIAIAEMNKGVLDFKSLNTEPKVLHEMWLSPAENESWSRAQMLLECGWYEEASKELDMLPIPTTPEGTALFGRFYSAAMSYPKAFRMLNKAWDESSVLRAMPFIHAAFPLEFQSTIQEESRSFGVNPFLITALIRQESSFRVRAVSSSGALGLMQMIPPTAQEIADSLKIKNFSIPQTLFEPTKNIKMGTYYFSQMLKTFNGNVPLALAAYNAGPTRLSRWTSSYGLKPQSTSSSDYDIWMDLMPWAETRFYVKAILRNYFIYQLLDLKPLQVKDPVWKSSEG